jgi:putative nucleotidyltransferase with HDIG domain
MTAKPPAPSREVRLLVCAVSVAGGAALTWASLALRHVPMTPWLLVLAAMTMLSSRFVIAVPGQPATVSVSEVFVFAVILLFGPAPAILIVAVDGLCVSLMHRNQRLYRTLFNVAEPAISTWVAGTVFFAMAGVSPLASSGAPATGLLLPSAAMSIAYFVFNTLLQSGAVAAENGLPFWGTWRQHAWYVAINYYAAGSLATLAVRSGFGIDLEVVGLIGPLLMLSYGAYKAAATRVDDAQRHVGEIEHLYQATVETLAIAVDAKDQVTHGHIRRVQRHTVALAKALGVTDSMELKALEAASLLHDIGKLSVPDYVLNKPGALTASEFEKIKLHATMGATILNTVEFPYPVVPIVRHHHEQWCGNGYPDKVGGDAIPLGARIVSVVDCFDALTSDRPYRRKLSDEAAVQILLERRGTMYDPRLVDAFIAMIPALRAEDHAIDGAAPPVPIVTAGVPDRDAAGIAATLGVQQLELVTRILRDRLAEVAHGAEACFFAQVDNGDALAASRWTPALTPIVTGRTMALGEGLVGWVAAHRHTIINSHADLDLGAAAAALDLGACTAVPVFAFGTLVGVLTFYLPKPLRFTSEQVPQLGVIAQQIGMALVSPDFGHVPQTPRPVVAA